ncbi:bifunctional transcriptional activator/DNA repair enzyme AdaA [Alicyclobacillus contaminans]|uniref:bifunctional transcriptional activator/DNA repair enzyme AdaA n=1 Tax=Alicyclobacillus contaminans TaxID=392016 RepID=UPI0004230E6F|nr:Ada metal-binding domain-containing protein [Alicyclobacillus contaminans]GMA52231.1 bifunctional transcriptional activator/DNA repair enzyme AdaA [Alicyclobacillus contaminans]
MREEQWQAIVRCDRAYDGQFVYAVRTTGVFCRPSCRSRTPKRSHVLVFPTAAAALAAQFRPCKRCRPQAEQLPDDDLVRRTVQYLDAHFSEPLTLEIIADAVHMSPYHLHRTFKRVMQVTPATYVRYKRISEAQRWLRESEISMVELAERLGFGNGGYFSTVFQKVVGMSPTTYRAIAREGVSLDKDLR